MAKVYITSSDPVVNKIYSQEETEELFGVDHLQDYGTEIPDELLKLYQENIKVFWEIQDALDFFKKG